MKDKGIKKVMVIQDIVQPKSPGEETIFLFREGEIFEAWINGNYAKPLNGDYSLRLDLVKILPDEK